MNSIIDLVKQQVSSDVINKIADQANIKPQDVQSIASQALPAILGGLGRNVQQPGGAQGLLDALKKHDGNALDNLGDMVAKSDTAIDGEKILGHVLGDKSDAVMTKIGAAAGVEPGSAKKVASLLGPIVLANIGKMAQGQKLDASHLTEELVKQTKFAGILDNPFVKMLDKDGDGSVVDDILGMFGKK